VVAFKEMLRELAEFSKRGYLPAGAMAPLCRLGGQGSSFPMAGEGRRGTDFDVVWLKIDPLFDLIHQNIGRLDIASPLIPPEVLESQVRTYHFRQRKLSVTSGTGVLFPAGINRC
jgi:hypothetical protein